MEEKSKGRIEGRWKGVRKGRMEGGREGRCSYSAPYTSLPKYKMGRRYKKSHFQKGNFKFPPPPLL